MYRRRSRRAWSFGNPAVCLLRGPIELESIASSRVAPTGLRVAICERPLSGVDSDCVGFRFGLRVIGQLAPAPQNSGGGFECESLVFLGCERLVGFMRILTIAQVPPVSD